LNGNKKVALVIGATSDIGQAIARRLAAEGYALELAGRNERLLAREANDIALRYGVTVSTHRFDALEPESLTAILDDLEVLPHVAVCVIGLLGVQEECEKNFAAAERVMITNYLAPVRLMGELANRFEARGWGVLVGTSSVAGDRGRASNYIYGSAKAGFSAFLSGLRNRLFRRGVHVLTVKPGFVQTRMTEALHLPPRLTAQPEDVADAVIRGISRRKDQIYVLPIWRLIMSLVVCLPESLFKRTRL
jgi:short-subunit dehydrogenase